MQAHQARRAPHVPQRIQRSGVYHPMWLSAPHGPEQAAWFEQTCQDVEAFVRAASVESDALPGVSLALHLAADHLFERHGRRACWSRLDPIGFGTRLAAMTGSQSRELVACLSVFYAFAADSGRIDSGRGHALASQLRALAAPRR